MCYPICLQNEGKALVKTIHGGGACQGAHVEVREQPSGSSSLSPWVLGIELSSSGLAQEPLAASVVCNRLMINIR